jgi:Uma2 family endonuclease
MASAAKRLITVDEFLALEFSGMEGFRVELDNGVISMMAGGSLGHGRVQRNLIGLLFAALRGSACGPFGSDTGIRTHDLSLRYPDVSIICGHEDAESDGLFEVRDPKVVFEILSPSTRKIDLEIKLREYCATASLVAIVYIDPEAETIRLLRRSDARGWDDEDLQPGMPLTLPSLGVSLTWQDVFARK